MEYSYTDYWRRLKKNMNHSLKNQKNQKKYNRNNYFLFSKLKNNFSVNQEFDIPLEIPSMPNEVNTEPIIKNLFTINSVIIESKKMPSDLQIKDNNSPLMTEENTKRTSTINLAKMNIERLDPFLKQKKKSLKKITNSYILPLEHLKEPKYLDVNFDDASRFTFIFLFFLIVLLEKTTLFSKKITFFFFSSYLY